MQEGDAINDDHDGSARHDDDAPADNDDSASHDDHRGADNDASTDHHDNAPEHRGADHGPVVDRAAHDFDDAVNNYIAAADDGAFDHRAAGYHVLNVITAGRKYLNDIAAYECGVHDGGADHDAPAGLVNDFVIAFANYIIKHDDDRPHIAAAAALVASAPARHGR